MVGLDVSHAFGLMFTLCFEDTLPETNIAPKNGWLEYYFPIGKADFRGYVSFRERILFFHIFGIYHRPKAHSKTA